MLKAGCILEEQCGEAVLYIRNNVLKLWSFVMEDLKSLGAKKLCPSLGKGIDKKNIVAEHL